MVWLAFGLLILAASAFVLWKAYRIYHIPSDGERREDIAALAEGDYELAVLSMYTTEAFDGQRFQFFCGVKTIQANHLFVNLADIGDYLNRALTANPDMSRVYIGLDPYAVSEMYDHHIALYARDYETYVANYIRENPQVTFQILIPSYSEAYLRGLSDREYEALLNSYRSLMNLYFAGSNVKIYFAGKEEWLTGNPKNYVTERECRVPVLQTIIAYTLRDDRYLLTMNNMEECFDQITKSLSVPAEVWPDLSGWCLVFLGDSVFEYHTGTFSIPDVVEGLTKAQIYNCSQGGMMASEDPEELLSFNRMVDRFLRQDTQGLSEDLNFCRGLSNYIQEEHEGKQYCFILSYGFNDYFQGAPVDNEADPYDVSTYAGALRAGILRLQQNVPEAKILLLAPNYTVEFGGGTQRLGGEQSGILTDYVKAAADVASEMDILFLNNYTESGINKKTEKQFLADGTHPSERGAFLLGRNLIRKLEENGVKTP